MKDNVLPQIKNPRSKSENKNGVHNMNSQQYLDQQKQSFYNNRQSSSKNQKRSHNYNFYAQPKNAIEVKISQNEYESTNSSNLWNELQVKKPNYRYPNTNKYTQSNKISLQQSNGRQLQSRDLIRSLTIDNNCNISNSKSRNYLDDLSIYNNAVNRLDTSSSQLFSQPLSKQMINIKNIVKNQSLTPISQSRFQELQINTNDNNGNNSNLRLSNQCFSTPHKSYYKDVNSKMLLNKSYDDDLKIKPPLLHKIKTNEKSKKTELKEIEEQSDQQLTENIIKNQNIQISLNRNHLKSISSSSNSYSKYNYNLASPQKLLQQYNTQQQSNMEQSQQGRIITDSEIQSNRNNQNNLSFHHTSVSKNKYLIDERKVVSIQVQNAEMDQYIRQVQKYVFKKQHNIDNNSSLSFKRPNVVHPSDLVQQIFNHQMKNNSSDQQLLHNLQQSNSNQDLMQTQIIENDIHQEQPLIMQQHTFQQKNQDLKQLQAVDQKLFQNNPKQGIDFNQQDQSSSRQTEQQNKNTLQSLISSTDVKSKGEKVEKDDQQDKNIEKQNNYSMNKKTISRQYSFSACYNQSKGSIPFSRNSEQANQTPKLNSQEKLQIPSQKYSLDQESSQENQQIKKEEIDFFDKKRSAEFGINYNSDKNSQKQIKNSSHQQLNNKNTQLELLQENTKEQINQNPQSTQNQRSSQGLSQNRQYITQTAQLSSQKSSNQSSFNTTQSYQIINQQSQQRSNQQSSQNSNQPDSQNSQQQSYQNSSEQSYQNSQQQSSQNSSRQQQQDYNRLISQGSEFPSQNSNNFSPYNCSKTKLLDQKLDSHRVQKQQQNQESSNSSQNKFMQFNPDKKNQIIITQERNSKQLSEKNSHSSNKSKQIEAEVNSDRNYKEETLQQMNQDQVNLPSQTNQNQIINANRQIDLDHNQISLPGAGASALESHQTASQQTSKKNSVSQQFYQGLFSNTLRKDPSFQNSDSHPNQFKQEKSPYSSNQDTHREHLNETNQDLLQQSIYNVQFQQNRENEIHQIELNSQINNQKQEE
ncbi:hypothetical protein ABPG72_021373 [Tetrahymena utriculariae]